MLCFSNSAKSLSSIIYSGNTLYLLISAERHLSSLVSALGGQEGCLLHLKTTLNIFILVLTHSQMPVMWNYTEAWFFFLIVKESHAPCGNKLWQSTETSFFFLNVACNLLHEETTTTDLVCVFSGLF